MTIYKLKALNKANGGQFFNRNTMAYFGDTLKNFSTRTTLDGHIHVTRKQPSRRNPAGGSWFFNATTGRMIGT